jgi:hypothetical protein
MDLSDFGNDLVSASAASYLLQMTQALPRQVDDVEIEFGIQTYRQIQNDPIAGSSIDFLNDLVLGDGHQWQPSHTAPTTPTPEESANALKASEMRDFVRWVTENLETPFEQVLDGLMTAVSFGYSVSEINYEVTASGTYAGKIIATDIVSKPRENVLFVTNQAKKILGFLAVKVGEIQNWNTFDPLNSSNFFPKEKFVWMTNRPLFGDPRGRSDLRRVHAAVEFKKRNKIEWFKHLMLNGSGKLIALVKFDPLNAESRLSHKTAADGTIMLDAHQQPMKITRVHAITQALAKSKNASVGAIEADELVQVEAKGNGEAFTEAENAANRDIATGILGAPRATQEAQNGSKADSETALDVVKAKSKRLKRNLAAALDQCLVIPLIRLNFGEEMLPFRPKLSLGSFQFNSMNAAAEWAKALGYTIDESQLPVIDKMIGVEERDMEAIQLREAQRAEEDRLAIQQATAAGTGT